MSKEDYHVMLVNLPYAVPSLISYDDQGEPLILINARYDYASQRKALDHEIEHDQHGDIYSDEDIRIIERRAG